MMLFEVIDNELERLNNLRLDARLSENKFATVTEQINRIYNLIEAAIGYSEEHAEECVESFEEDEEDV